MTNYIAVIVTAILVHQIIKERKLMATVEEVKAAVAAESTVISSAVTLINGLAAQVEAAKTDPAALDEVIANMKASSDALAAAVAANTPAAPPAEETPAPAAEG